jgi:hypothetical protein
MAQKVGLGKSSRFRHMKRMDNPRDKPGDRGTAAPAGAAVPAKPAAPDAVAPAEIGGPKGPEPTRYGDWEIGGRCTDF